MLDPRSFRPNDRKSADAPRRFIIIVDELHLCYFSAEQLTQGHVQHAHVYLSTSVTRSTVTSNSDVNSIILVRTLSADWTRLAVYVTGTAHSKLSPENDCHYGKRAIYFYITSLGVYHVALQPVLWIGAGYASLPQLFRLAI